MRYSTSAFLLIACVNISNSSAFTASNPNKVFSPIRDKHSSTTSLNLSKKNNENNNKNEASSEKKLITKEMFLRDMLSDPESVNITDGQEVSSDATVRRKKKNGSHYRTLDNRDSLPFLVKVATPDPYTNNAQMKKQARLNTERQRRKEAKSKSKNGKGADVTSGKRRQNMIGMDGKDSISSSIFTRGEDGEMHKIVGEFALDKSTNCGDIIEVGDGTEYQVQKARCQYKYAGGKRFVMTRKILEVKEIKRVLVEKEVQELFDKEIDIDDGSIGSEELI